MVDSASTMEGGQKTRLLIHETCNNNRKVQEAIRKQSERLNRKVSSPTKTRRPLRELTRQGSNQTGGREKENNDER